MLDILQQQIQNLVDLEKKAWDEKDSNALVSLFHPDMIWPWPLDENSHDPAQWVFPMGRFDRERWKSVWQDLFDNFSLIHNKRQTVKIVVSEQGDGAYAVVDVDTLWRDKEGKDFHWLGRACKGYTKVDQEWKLIMHTGLLKYE